MYVVSPVGVEQTGAQIRVSDASSRVISKSYMSGGVRFCDLGILPATVTVGPQGSCNQVVVHNVTLKWQKQYDLKVTYDPRPCQVTAAPPRFRYARSCSEPLNRTARGSLIQKSTWPALSEKPYWATRTVGCG